MKLSTRDERLQKLHKPAPHRSLFFMLYEPKKVATLGHVFRLAEGFGAELLFVGNSLLPSTEIENELTGFFGRWRSVAWQHCADVSTMLTIIAERRLHPVVLEITSTTKPFHELRLPSGKGVALIIGSEDTGLNRDVLDVVDDHVYIPMVGQSSCLSAPMALAIVASHVAYVTG